MRSIFFVFALCAAFVGTMVEGWAGAFGSSILNVSNLRLQYSSDGTNWSNATTDQGVISSRTLESYSTATLGGVTQSNFQPNLNAAMSFVGPSFAPPPTQQLTVPLQSYTSLGMGLNRSADFAVADTNGSDVSVDIISPGGISVSTLAELNTLGSVTAMAQGDLSATNKFRFTSGVAGQFRIAFDASFAMETTGDGTASVSFSVTGNSPGNTMVYTPAALNPTEISGNSSLTLGNTFFTSGSLFVGLNQTASFDIAQLSRVGASVVPEPSSIAIFGLMSVGSLAAWRRRRAGERKSAEA